MTPFELLEPASLREAIALLDPDDFVGAADRRRHRADADDEGRRVPADAARQPAQARGRACAHRRRISADGDLTIGAMTPLAMVEHSRRGRARIAPVIVRTMRRLSNIRVRNVATIGGNLAHGDPHMDLPPVLIALGARVMVTGPDGERSIAVEDLFAGYYETVLAEERADRRAARSRAGQHARRLS